MPFRFVSFIPKIRVGAGKWIPIQSKKSRVLPNSARKYPSKPEPKKESSKLKTKEEPIPNTGKKNDDFFWFP